MTDTTKPLALLTEVGPGTGLSLVRRFAECGYRVATLAHDADRLAGLEAEIADTVSAPCDVNADALGRAIAEVGMPKVVVHNVVGGAFGTFMNVEAETLRQNFEVDTIGAVPSGAAYDAGDDRGGKARSSSPATARRSAPRRCAVLVGAKPANTVPWQRELQPTKPDDFFISPKSIAAEVLHLAHQPHNAWSSPRYARFTSHGDYYGRRRRVGDCASPRRSRGRV
ncbi:short-chain dehydrogenase [Bradyrhizobium sp. CSA207]|uniref:short-chain dehydrogenase n=1 Tax=Bradyrhizobium sp. CSA207 TaxID=2698826 RepID=UPI0023B1454F|nr:short-chain dehydrogenase [Bradyrhizobium sp. CSA207]